MVQQVVQLERGSPPEDFHGILTVAPEMRRILTVLSRVAKTDMTVMIEGETGSGKELIARAIHAESRRSQNPFQTLNCATLSPTLLESEMFGHKRGAFTGAIRDHPGLFRMSHKGTLFLDEVADIPLDLQGRLLRVLQEKTFLPLGATQPVSVDVRIVSATNRVLRKEVAGGRFREDLSYRIRVVSLLVPPLRERTGDVQALFWHFVAQMNQQGLLNQQGLRHVSAVSRRALDALLSYRWPGNVRELISAVEYAFAVGEGPVLDMPDLPAELRAEQVGDFNTPRSDAHHEREKIRAALEKHQGRKTAAANELGICRQTLWRKMSIYGLR